MPRISLPRPLTRALLAPLAAAALALSTLHAQQPSDTAAASASSGVAAPASQPSGAPPAATPAPSTRAGTDAKDTKEASESRAASSAAGERLPEPFWLALLAMVLCGAIGAFAADLVTDGGRIDRWKENEDGLTLGSLGKLVVGAVAAVIILSLNPSGIEWWRLIGSALTAGLGGEAVLLAVINGRKAQDAENKRDEAEAKAVRKEATALEKVESMRALTLAARRGTRVRLEHVRISAEDAPAATASESAEDEFEHLVNTAAERARAEIVAA